MLRDQWEIVNWLWQCFRHDLAPVVSGLPYADGRYQPGELAGFPSPDGAGYLAWRPHPKTGEDVPIGFALVGGLTRERRSLVALWVAPVVRREGVGFQLSLDIIARHPGAWSIALQHDNHGRACSGAVSPTPRLAADVGEKTSARCPDVLTYRQTTGSRPSKLRNVVNPFELEEIFPEGRETAVRLPRRQSGSSPQGLAVTLIADYTLRTRGWLPSAAIVALLEEFGVSSGGARTAISRLARRGVLEGSRQGRQSFYRLTRPAAFDLVSGGHSIATFTTHADSWDGSWTLIVFSMPEEESTQRRALRDRLRWWGYAPLYDGVWVSPHPLPSDLRAELSAVSLGALTVFHAYHLELESMVARSPIEAWDVAGVAKEYESFIRKWSRLVPRITAGRVTGTRAVRARTEVMDTYRRFPVLDPLLPLKLLPSGWPRARAREVFVAVYDGLAGPAREHVRAVVARTADGLDLGIQTHTVADMDAGVTKLVR